VSSYAADDGHLQWETRSHGSLRGPVTVGDGVAAVVLDDRHLSVFDLGSGDRRWDRDLGTTTVATPMLVGDRVVTVSRAGLVTAREGDQLTARPVAGGDPRWSLTVGAAPLESPPVVSGDTVYAATSDGRLDAVALADGTLRWQTPAGDPTSIPTTPLVLPGG